MELHQLRALLSRPIAYYRLFAELSGGACNGIFLSQLWYWSENQYRNAPESAGWFYKTADEWRYETGMTTRELETARKNLKQRGLLLEHTQVTPTSPGPVLHYCLNVNRLLAVINEHLEPLPEIEFSNLPPTNSAKRQIGAIQQNVKKVFNDSLNSNSTFCGIHKGTETTTKTTAKTTSAVAGKPRNLAKEKNKANAPALQAESAKASHTRGAATDVHTWLREDVRLSDLLEAGGLAERVMKMEKPLTQEQADKLVEKWGLPAVREILQDMGNYKDLLKRGTVAYSTADNWLRRRGVAVNTADRSRPAAKAPVNGEVQKRSSTLENVNAMWDTLDNQNA